MTAEDLGKHKQANLLQLQQQTSLVPSGQRTIKHKGVDACDAKIHYVINKTTLLSHASICGAKVARSAARQSVLDC